MLARFSFHSNAAYSFAAKLLDFKNAVLVGDICSWIAVFRERNGACIYEISALCLFGTVNVSVTADINIALVYKGHILLIIKMTVGAEKKLFLSPDCHIIGSYGEFKHHAVNLRFAVSSDAEELCFNGIEHFNDFLGCIFLGKIVAGTVIEKVTQKNEPFGLFLLKTLHQLPAAGSAAVYI